MTRQSERFVQRACVVAVHAALAALAITPAQAADEHTAADLTKAQNTVEVGVGYVSDDSAKFGEYNGLSNKGAFGIGNVLLNGGAPYDSDSTLRWKLFGYDLGLETRTLGGEVGEQGKYRLRYIYDELRREASDSYRTFYQGAGGNALTIPAFADVPPSSRLSSTTTANGALANWQNIQAPYATAACAAIGGVPSAACAGPGYRIPAAMQDFDVSTKRKKHDLDFAYEIMPSLEFKASVRHEDKDGTKLTGVAFGGPARGVLVPEPIHFTTDQYRASIGWVSGPAFVTLGYLGSTFNNDTNVWTVENPFNGNLLNPAFANQAHMVGAPDNEMHQLHLSGGYSFNPTTRLVLTGNYQRMTQNESFDSSLPSTWTLPETSPHAKVINTNFTATLTSRPIKELALNAQYKYEDRDNQTPSVNFIVLGGDAAGNPSLFTNRPLNFKTNQFGLDADWRFAKGQAARVSYEWKKIDRSVDATPPPPAELESPFARDRTTENTVRLEYKNTMSQQVNGRLSWAYSQRRGSEYEQEPLLPVNPPAPFPAADPELQGFKQFFLTDRNRNKLRGMLNVQASNALSFQGGVEYNQDHYTDLSFGLKNVKAFVLNLDGAYAMSERVSFNAYYTYEDRKSELDSLVIGRGNSTTILDAPASTTPCSGFFAAAGHQPSDLGTDPCRQWSEAQSDRIHTIGAGMKFSGLWTDRFDLGVDAMYQHAVTPISVSGGAYFGNGSTAPGPAFNNIFIAAQSFPDITTEMVQLRFTGTYALDKVSAIRMVYEYGT